MRNILILVSIFVLAFSGGETSRPDKMFKAFDSGTVVSLDALEPGHEPDKFTAGVTAVTAVIRAPAIYSPTFSSFQPGAVPHKPFARAPPLVA